MNELWKGEVGNISQTGGHETSVVDNSPAIGSQIAWFNTDGGLQKVVIDRCLNGSDTFYNQYSLAWFSYNGPIAPRSHADRGLEWLYAFSGGLITTYGLTHIGGPEADKDEGRKLHGRISNLSSSLESVIQVAPICGRMDTSITAVTEDSPHLKFRRTITSTLGQAVIVVHDELTNQGNISCPHRILYHCNFSRPLAEEGANIVYRGTCRYREINDKLFNGKRSYKKYQKTLSCYCSAGESCGIIDVSPNPKGICCVGLVNHKLNLALTIKYPKQQLPILTNRQHWGYGEHVCVLEPGTNPPIGQNEVRALNELVMLEPGEKKCYDLEFRILSGSDEIRNFMVLMEM